jgi:putative two-component system response regulator
MEPTQLFGQLIRYAEDLNRAVRAEQESKQQLDASKAQLLRFAEDLNTTFLDLKIAHREMKHAYLDTIHRLALAAEHKDEDTGDHIVRMSRFCALLAEEIGLSEKEVQRILYASPMHDIGKIGIPDSILLKKGRLTGEEFDVIKTHTTIGAKILSDSGAKILQMAESIALHHHEKWNGKGYPAGLGGEDIPIEGRIVALPDTFDALTSKRPYKGPYPVDVAVDIIRKERGEHFDPQIVDAFLDNFDKIEAIREEVGADAPIERAFAWSERDQAGR